MTTIDDSKTGQIPTDLSLEASQKRSHQMNISDCTATPIPAEWDISPSVTIEQKCVLLATVTGPKMKFAHSLALQFSKNGELSRKQIQWVNRLYRDYAEQNKILRRMATQHDWQNVGTDLHQSNYMLGTYQQTTYYECSKCAAQGERYKSKNYSGD